MWRPGLLRPSDRSSPWSDPRVSARRRPRRSLPAQARMLGRTVTLVGCDAFRVGAAEQLARYAGLIDARLEAANTSDQLTNIILDARTHVVIRRHFGSLTHGRWS